jgi:flagellar hook-length control protein FliK
MTMAVMPLPADPVAATATPDAAAQGPLLSGEFLTVLLQLVRLDGAAAPVIGDPTITTSPDAMGEDGPPLAAGSEPRALATLDPRADASLISALIPALGLDAGARDGEDADDGRDTTGPDAPDGSITTAAATAVAAATPVPVAVLGAATPTPDARDGGPSADARATLAARARADAVITPSAAAAPRPDAAKPSPGFDASADGADAATNVDANAPRDPGRTTITPEPGEASAAARLEPVATARAATTDSLRLLRDRAIVLRAVGDADEAWPAGPEPRSPAEPATGMLPEQTAATARAESATRTETPAVAPRTVVEQVTERVVFLRRDGRGEITLRLDPPDLGAVRIEAVMEGGRLRLEIRAEAEPARQALEASLPRLRESLAQQGIVADQVSVHLGLDSAPRDFTGGQPAPATRPLSPPPAAPPARPAAPLATVAAIGADGVDVWV